MKKNVVNKATWWFRAHIGRGSYNCDTTHQLIHELENDFRKYYGEILCINPDWESKEGEILYPQKMIMCCLGGIFDTLRQAIPDEELRREQSHMLFRLLDTFQMMISEVSMEATFDAKQEYHDLIISAFGKREIISKEEYQDIYNALEKMRELRNEERSKYNQVEREKILLMVKKRGGNILSKIDEGQREKFVALAGKAKRFKSGTKKGQISSHALAKTARNKFPHGYIGGRKIDEKLVSSLLKSLNIR